MIRNRTLAVLAGAALTSLAAPAQAQMYEKISVTNSTGYTIAEIYMSPSRTYDWEEDILGRDLLDDGGVVEIDFRRSVETCDWDLKVVYGDGEEAVWDRLDLCEDWQFELFYNARSGDTHLTSSH